METFKVQLCVTGIPKPVTAYEVEKYKETLVLTRQPLSRLNEHFDPTCWNSAGQFFYQSSLFKNERWRKKEVTEENDETASAEFHYRFWARCCCFTCLKPQETVKLWRDSGSRVFTSSRRVTPHFLCRGVKSSRLGALNESTLISLICESSRRLKPRSHIWTSATVRHRRHGENHKNRENTKGLWSGTADD